MKVNGTARGMRWGRLAAFVQDAQRSANSAAGVCGHDLLSPKARAALAHAIASLDTVEQAVWREYEKERKQ